MLIRDMWGASPQTNTRRFIVAIAPGGRNIVRQIPVPDAEHGELAARAIAEEGWNAFFAPAAFRDTRTQRDALFLPAFWLDLDVADDGVETPNKYGSTEAAAVALWRWLHEHQMPEPTHVVASGGGGLHVYWRLTEDAPLEAWQPVAARFKQALKVAGIKADPTRTADAASVLRVPNTVHTKDMTRPRLVRLLRREERRVSLEEFAAALPALGPQRLVERTPLPAEWDVSTPFDPADAELVAAQCGQMRIFRERGGAVSEPYWRAGLSVLARCIDGDRLIHDWSKGDPRYNPNETAKKAAGTKGPATCAHFDTVNPGGCAGCPHAGRVTSPIVLGRVPKAPEPPPEAPYRVGRFRRFTINSQGVWYDPPTVEGGQPEPPVKVCEYPLWVVEIRHRATTHETQAGAVGSYLEWDGPAGTRRRVLPHSVLLDASKLRGWMAEEGLGIAVRDWKLMTYYIAEMSLDAARRGVTYFYDQAGWVDGNTAFVVGRRKITADGEHHAVLEASGPSARLGAAAGDLEAWKRAAALLAPVGREKLAYATLHALGSPLLSQCGLQGAVLSLAGESGAGKTVSMKFALSVYGDPEALYMQGGSSVLAISSALAAHQHMPLGIDELTVRDPRSLRDLAYLVANGRPDSKLKRTGEAREIQTWCLNAIVTTNMPILSNKQTDVNEAARRRIIEIDFDRPLEAAIGAQLRDAAAQNPGVALAPYMQAVIRARERLPELLAQAQAWLAQRYRWPDSQRFALWSLAAALVGGAIAAERGLLPGWDVQRIVDAAARAVDQNVVETLPPSELARQMTAEWITEHAQQVVWWRTGTNYVDVHGVRDPLVRVLGDNEIAIHQSRLLALLRDAGVSQRVVAAALAVKERRKVRLLPDLPPVWCYIVDPAALGIELAPLAGGG